MGKKRKGESAASGSWDAVQDEALNFSFKTTQARRKGPDSERGEDRYQRDYYGRNKGTLSERAAERWRTNAGGYRDRGLARAKEKRSLERGIRAAEKFDRAMSNYSSGWWCRACDGRFSDTIKRPTVCPNPKCKTEGSIQRAVIVTVALCSKCARTLPWDGVVRECGIVQQDGRTCRGRMEEGERVLTCKPPRLVRACAAGITVEKGMDDETWVYSSGTLAAFVGKDPSTIRTWIEERVIPGCSIEMSGRYWFTEELMRAIADGYRETLFLDGRAPHSKLRRWVRATIEERGVKFSAFPEKG